MFREGCLEPTDGVALKENEIKMVKNAFTKYMPGNIDTSENDNGDTTEARTFFIKLIGDRFLPEEKDKLFLLNNLLCTQLHPAKEYNDISEGKANAFATDVIVAGFKVVLKVSRVAIIMDVSFVSLPP